MNPPIEYYELVKRRIEEPKPGEFFIATAAVWPCALCGRSIDGMGGPGSGEVCVPCGDELKAGHLKGAVVWNKTP